MVKQEEGPPPAKLRRQTRRGSQPASGPPSPPAVITVAAYLDRVDASMRQAQTRGAALAVWADAKRTLGGALGEQVIPAPPDA